VGWRCCCQSTTRTGTTRCNGLGIVLRRSRPVGEPLIAAVPQITGRVRSLWIAPGIIPTSFGATGEASLAASLYSRSSDRCSTFSGGDNTRLPIAFSPSCSVWDSCGAGSVQSRLGSQYCGSDARDVISDSPCHAGAVGRLRRASTADCFWASDPMRNQSMQWTRDDARRRG